MKLTVEINNTAKSPVDSAFFAPIIKETIDESGINLSGHKKINVSVALVSGEVIKKINRTFRKKNITTDILSFSEYASRKEIQDEKGDNLFLGELILCYDDIRKYFGKRKINIKKELAEVISHGTLHLLNFKHGKKMFEIQNKVANQND